MAAPHASFGADRIHGFTRWVAAVLGAIVLGAFIVLYFFPADTARLFAWNIQPPMTAMFMGASYANGCVFFAAVLGGRKWHEVWAPHVGVFLFATLLLVTTVLHWDRFNHAHPVFFAWVIVYAIAPIVVLWALIRNLREDPRAPEASDREVPVALRRVWLVPATTFLVVAAVAFVNPAWLIPHWPWKASPLTMRVMVSFYSLLGAAVWAVQREPRWSAWRVGTAGVFVWHLLILVAALVRRQDFTHGPLHHWWYTFEAALVLGTLLTYLRMEARAGRRS